MSVRVSVVIPAYNEEKHLASCLDAIAAQTDTPDEVIIVNNNSTDKTAEIARSYPFVRLLTEKRQGLRFTRNTGLDAATGDVIGRIDADTILDPNWCHELRRLFTDEAVMAASGPCYYVDMPAQQFTLAADRLVRQMVFKAGGPLLYGSNMAMRRDVWQAIRKHVCMHGEFFEDYDLSIHVQSAGYQITFDPKLVVGVSARILDNPLKEYSKTMQLHSQTFAMHGKHSSVAAFAKYAYLAVYPIGKAARQMYDPENETLSLRYLATHTKRATRPTSNT